MVSMAGPLRWDGGRRWFLAGRRAGNRSQGQAPLVSCVLTGVQANSAGAGCQARSAACRNEDCPVERMGRVLVDRGGVRAAGRTASGPPVNVGTYTVVASCAGNQDHTAISTTA